MKKERILIVGTGATCFSHSEVVSHLALSESQERGLTIINAEDLKAKSLSEIIQEQNSLKITPAYISEPLIIKSGQEIRRERRKLKRKRG
jgi:hypothetical protein